MKTSIVMFRFGLMFGNVPLGDLLFAFMATQGAVAEGGTSTAGCTSPWTGEGKTPKVGALGDAGAVAEEPKAMKSELQGG